jgi:hypothetical protein
MTKELNRKAILFVATRLLTGAKTIKTRNELEILFASVDHPQIMAKGIDLFETYKNQFNK